MVSLFCIISVIASLSDSGIAPQLYFPFEISHSSKSNWSNHGLYGPGFSESLGDPSAVSPSIDTNGLRGSCENVMVGSAATPLVINTYKDSVTRAFVKAKSITTTFWVKANGTGPSFNDSYIWHYSNTSGSVAVRWRKDGKLFLYYMGSWYGGAVITSNGQWKFISITVDVNNNGIIKFYSGSQSESVYMLDSVQAEISALPSEDESGIFALNAWFSLTNLNNLRSPGMYLDELRIYTSTENEAVFNIEQLESIRLCDMYAQFDPYAMSIDGDNNSDNCVNFSDLLSFAQHWLIQTVESAFVQGDMNANNNVELLDYATLASNWQSCGSNYPSVTQVDTLCRAFPDIKPVPLPEDLIYHVPRGGKVCFQFAIKGQTPTATSCQLSLAKLGRAVGGTRMANLQYKFYEAIAVRVEANTNGCSVTAAGTIPPADWLSHFTRTAPFYMPEALKPVAQVSISNAQYTTIVLEIQLPEDAAEGHYKGTINFKTATYSNSAPIEFVVHKTILAGSDYSLYSDHWLNADPKNLCYGVSVPAWWSQEHWNLLEVSAKALRDYGENIMFTPLVYGSNPLIKPILDNGELSFDYTMFDRWITTFSGMGFKWFEGEHLLNKSNLQPLNYVYFYNVQKQSNVTYLTPDSSSGQCSYFFDYFLSDLYSHLQERGWINIYKQHIMDEPSSYTNLASGYQMVKTAMPNIETLDAIHSWGQDPAGFSPNTDIFIFYVDLLSQNPVLAQQRLDQGKKNWLYLFCKPYPPMPNMHLDSYLTCSRLYPILCYKFNATGMIHWAANVYRGANPYLTSIGPVPSGSQNPGHPLGDNWLYYPSSNGLIGSIRMLNFRDGMLDYYLLNLLSLKNKAKADALLLELVRSLNDFEELNTRKYHEMRRKVLEALDG